MKSVCRNRATAKTHAGCKLPASKPNEAMHDPSRRRPRPVACHQGLGSVLTRANALLCTCEPHVFKRANPWLHTRANPRLHTFAAVASQPPPLPCSRTQPMHSESTSTTAKRVDGSTWVLCRGLVITRAFPYTRALDHARSLAYSQSNT
eukprot:6199581-Pleurochrysis_carterae.AAC.1